MEIAINYLAVIIAAISSMFIGALWYSPILFGNTWMKLIGITSEDLEKAKKKGMAKTYMLNFITSLVMAYVLAHFVGVWGAVGVGGAFQLAFWLWLGFVATIMAGSFLWEGRPVKLYFLNVSYQLVALFVMAAILALWS